MAAEVNKPSYQYVWASGGAIVAPSDVKVQTGWTAEVPPFQWENYLQNRQDNAILHLFQKGISEWDAVSNYYFTTSGVRSYVQGSDGIIYVAVQDSVGQNPTTDVSDTYWKVAFADNSTALTTTTGDARYTQRANNLSDVANTTTARTNLGAAPTASPTFTGVPVAPTAAVGTNTTQLATTAFAVNQDLGGTQTLQTLTGSRTLLTNYTNATGRAIYITVRAITDGGSAAANRIGIQINGGAEYYGAGTPGGGAGYPLSASGIIPIGATYRANINNASLLDWSELR